jgi:hypothetical protein
MKIHTTFWLGNLKGKDPFGDTGMDRKIILKWAFK